MSKLKELCDVLVPMRDKPKMFVNETNGVPWCRIEDIEGKYLYGTTSGQYVDGDTIDKMNLKVFPSGTVICACTGASIGTYAITKRDLITNQTFAGLVCGEKLYNHFLYYFVKLYTKAFIDKSVGCAQAYITRETFENIELPDIPFEKQKEIVASLEMIDDKIENNNAICSELEAMAKLLYDYWFVQFDFPDPSGKPYKSSGGKMVWNEKLKREIPDAEGWGVKRVGDMITTERGISYSTPNIETGKGVPMLNLATFKPGGGDYKADGLKHFLGDYPKNKVLRPYELIMCNTQQTAIKFETDIIGRAMLVPDIFDGDVVFSHHVNVIRTQDENAKYYLLYLFNSDYYHKYISGFTNGTNILGLSFNGVEDYWTEVPSSDLLKRFGKIVLEVERKKSEIIVENQQLASLRDFLLPMLMNGQVKVGAKKNST